MLDGVTLKFNGLLLLNLINKYVLDYYDQLTATWHKQ